MFNLPSSKRAIMLSIFNFSTSAIFIIIINFKYYLNKINSFIYLYKKTYINKNMISLKRKKCSLMFVYCYLELVDSIFISKCLI